MLKVINLSLSLAVSLLGLAMILFVLVNRPVASVPVGLILGIIFLITGLLRVALYRRLP